MDSLDQNALNKDALDRPTLRIHTLGTIPYEDTLAAMQHFTNSRSGATADECWILEHPPVFTQGLAGKPEHVLQSSTIPIVQSDRGGQVTYHGPGQLVVYWLCDLRRMNSGPKAFVHALEEGAIQTLNTLNIPSERMDNAPGVYVHQRKIASLGLRVRHGCTYHGISVNVDMDLAPFKQINPCGYAGLAMTQIADEWAKDSKALSADDISSIATTLVLNTASQLGYDASQIEWAQTAPASLPNAAVLSNPALSVSYSRNMAEETKS